MIDIKDFIKQEKAKMAKVPIMRYDLVYVSAKEYARRLNIHYVTLVKWLDAGKIEGAQKIAGRWKIPLKTGE